MHQLKVIRALQTVSMGKYCNAMQKYWHGFNYFHFRIRISTINSSRMLKICSKHHQLTSSNKAESKHHQLTSSNKEESKKLGHEHTDWQLWNFDAWVDAWEWVWVRFSSRNCIPIQAAMLATMLPLPMPLPLGVFTPSNIRSWFEDCVPNFYW